MGLKLHSIGLPTKVIVTKIFHQGTPAYTIIHIKNNLIKYLTILMKIRKQFTIKIYEI